jgi:hypothetical protein
LRPGAGAASRRSGDVERHGVGTISRAIGIGDGYVGKLQSALAPPKATVFVKAVDGPALSAMKNADEGMLFPRRQSKRLVELAK